MTSAHPAFDVRIFHKEARSLARAGFEVTLVVPHRDSQRAGEIEILAVPMATGRFARLLRTTRAVYRRARAADADVYHFHDPELIPAGLLLRLRGKKVIYDIHEDLPGSLAYKDYLPGWLRRPLGRIVDLVERAASRQFSGLVAATPEIAARFAGHPNVATVQNYPMREEFRAPESGGHRGNYVTYVGLRITRARGAREMIEALQLVPSSIPVRLRLVGTIEPPELLDSLAASPGWSSTEYMGPLGRTGISEVLSGAIAGLVVLHPEPNYVNSHPVKLFEYMCAGIPVVASDFPVFRSIVEGAGCGILVDPLAPAEIAAAIVYLATHPEEAREMGERGRAAIDSRYNWRREEERLLDVYRRVALLPRECSLGAELT